MMIDSPIAAQDQFASTRVYHDLNSLAQLKNKGDGNDPELIREAAKQFESIFMGMMLKSMRDASSAIVGEQFLDSSQLGMYQDMYDEQLTLHLGSTSGLGLTDVLVQQLTGNPSTQEEIKEASKVDGIFKSGSSGRFKTQTNDTEQSFNPLRITGAIYQNDHSTKVEAVDLHSVIKQSQIQKVDKNIGLTDRKVALVQQTNQVASAIEKQEDKAIDFSSPSAFVSSLWPYAKQAAQVLKLDPKILIAQAALETGWGKFVIKNHQGESSKNLFGIKANSDWSGDSTRVKSLEVIDGTAVQKQSDFRSYANYSESFKDYAQFISSKNRYQKAVDVASKPTEYVEQLQAAGYATDPNYADKIKQIYNSSTLNDAISLKD